MKRGSRRVRRMVTMSDGVSLAVCEWGPRNAERTVVLLHGCCLNKDSWSIQVAELLGRWGDNIRIIAYDHRGHGESAMAPMHTYTIEQLAADLAELLVFLDVAGVVILAGHSMGVMAILAYLGRATACRPVEPQGLVLVAGAAGKRSPNVAWAGFWLLRARPWSTSWRTTRRGRPPTGRFGPSPGRSGGS